MDVKAVPNDEYEEWLQPQLPPGWETTSPCWSVEAGWIVVAKATLHYNFYVLRVKDGERVYKVGKGSISDTTYPEAPTPAAAIAAWEMTR